MYNLAKARSSHLSTVTSKPLAIARFFTGVYHCSIRHLLFLYY